MHKKDSFTEQSKQRECYKWDKREKLYIFQRKFLYCVAVKDGSNENIEIKKKKSEPVFQQKIKKTFRIEKSCTE